MTYTIDVKTTIHHVSGGLERNSYTVEWAPAKYVSFEMFMCNLINTIVVNQAKAVDHVDIDWIDFSKTDILDDKDVLDDVKYFEKSCSVRVQYPLK